MILLAAVFTLHLYWDPHPGTDSGVGIGMYGGASLEECHRLMTEQVLGEAANYHKLELGSDGKLREIAPDLMEAARVQFIEEWRGYCEAP